MKDMPIWVKAILHAREHHVPPWQIEKSMSEQIEEPTHRWQPVVLFLADGKRLECECGALAVFVRGHVADNGYNHMEKVDVWCQSCWIRAIEEEDNDA